MSHDRPDDLQDVPGLELPQPPVHALPALVPAVAAAADIQPDQDVAQAAGQEAVPAHTPGLADCLAPGFSRSAMKMRVTVTMGSGAHLQMEDGGVAYPVLLPVAWG